MIVLPYHGIDPVIVEIGPLFGVGPIVIRWYAVSYIVGIVLGWLYILRLLRTPAYWIGPAHRGVPPATAEDIGDLVVWVTLGIILGGRLGFVLFYGLVYSPDYYLENPLRIFMAWEGGMAFHGGLIGATLAVVIFCMRRGIHVVKLGDLMFAAAPIGIFLVRIANFINGELWGKVSNVPWAMVFPDERAGPDPRHPSQLYEAVLEGLLLFVVIRLLITRAGALDRPGVICGVFLIGYSAARIFSEVFRDSDQYIFYPNSGFTMGMLLSLPMAFIGIGFLVYAYSGRNGVPGGWRVALGRG
ncbi:MAG TPA: prolipoprotein diacylglyceryl transferase [Alphaproteobacteria bacterium]|nr:prolipoprotein diacylglyceryl transferase [Alphaproteobacteria bacterium]HAJ48187.1 prolipoprotein diacylglyceryl transferase [Alphaproteobacteria bacterium]